jgi:hypothetical protein
MSFLACAAKTHGGSLTQIAFGLPKWKLLNVFAIRQTRASLTQEARSGAEWKWINGEFSRLRCENSWRIPHANSVRVANIKNHPKIILL